MASIAGLYSFGDRGGGGGHDGHGGGEGSRGFGGRGLFKKGRIGAHGARGRESPGLAHFSLGWKEREAEAVSQ